MDYFYYFFGVLNETVFNVSTPSIADEYGLTPSGVSWVLTAFIIFFGIRSVIYGKLSDIYRSVLVLPKLWQNQANLMSKARDAICAAGLCCLVRAY